MSNAVSGIGTIFSRYDGSQWVPIAEITSITGPNKSRNTIDVTSFDSVDGYKEFIGGLRDGGEFNFTMNFTEAGYILINDDFEDDTLQKYRVTLPNTEGTVLEFDGLVTALPLDVPLDDKISCSVTIKISGQTELNPSA